jgi:type II secretory pathway component PulK
MNRLRQKRYGMVLILMLGCLAVATALLVVGVKLAVLSHRAAQDCEHGVQAQWLAESAVERAAAKLAADAAYAGETWLIPAKELGGDESGVVKISINAIPQRTNGRLVKVEADFPDDPLAHARCSKEITLELK